jgi:hypothetical protein
MKINLFYNGIAKNIEINTKKKIGIILEDILNNSFLMIYNIEKCELIINDNNIPYIFGSDEMLFSTIFEDFLKNIDKSEDSCKNIILYDRLRDDNGNVIKNNITIDRYNNWYTNNESENFIQYNDSNYNYGENRHIIRFPLNTLLNNIFSISHSYINNYNNQNLNDNLENENTRNNLDGEDENINNNLDNENNIHQDKNMNNNLDGEDENMNNNLDDENNIHQDKNMNNNLDDEDENMNNNLDGKDNLDNEDENMNNNLDGKDNLDNEDENTSNNLYNEDNLDDEDENIYNDEDNDYINNYYSNLNNNAESGTSYNNLPNFSQNSRYYNFQNNINRMNNLDNIINIFDTYLQNNQNNLFNIIEEDLLNPNINEAPEFIPISDINILNNIFYTNNSNSNTYTNLQEDVKIIISEENFEKIENINYENLNLSESNECQVCTEEFNKDDEIKKLNCSHIFHKDCIKPWLCEESNKCPVCRVEVEGGIHK